VRKIDYGTEYVRKFLVFLSAYKGENKFLSLNFFFIFYKVGKRIEEVNVGIS
jgi:hypothetical protein